jgi:hypothetical protein
VSVDERISLAYDHARVMAALDLTRKVSEFDGPRNAAFKALNELARAIEKRQGELSDEAATYTGTPSTLEKEERMAAGRCMECGAEGGYVRGRHHYSDCSRKKR